MERFFYYLGIATTATILAAIVVGSFMGSVAFFQGAHTAQRLETLIDSLQQMFAK